ncbi:anti-sigma factor family protein [Novosphingobium piscinae]|uniref:Anti-sigma factor n=1 Tax=Novosphingobium piscinae TaxID=1507448 RepID=A0A7X1FZ90_9SPHN|nr:hypothetical protein [Novosphingobium piscinae]MBC2669661.1 hypothetical protein [Novosphingobium piscinae]
MNGKERPTDQDAQQARLSAWLDGELDKEGADSMSALISTDESLAGRAERMQRIDALVRAAVPEEDVPAELLQRLGLAPSTPTTEVVDLAVARRERSLSATPAAAQRQWSGPALWRIAAQVLVIGGVGLGAALWLTPGEHQAEPAAAYRTLSNAPRAAQSAAPVVNAVIVFANGTDSAAVQQLAATAGARLVGPPNGAGAWKASIAPGRRDAVLDALRRDRRVTMAEPLDGATP